MSFDAAESQAIPLEGKLSDPATLPKTYAALLNDSIRKAPADMTGIEPLQQAWTVVRNGGYVRTCSIGHPAGANVSFPAAQWANAAKTHVPGNYAGVQAMRDLPRFVRLIEAGLFDAKSLVGPAFPMDRAVDAVKVAAERTAITSVIQFS